MPTQWTGILTRYIQLCKWNQLQNFMEQVQLHVYGVSQGFSKTWISQRNMNKIFWRHVIIATIYSIQVQISSQLGKIYAGKFSIVQLWVQYYTFVYVMQGVPGSNLVQHANRCYSQENSALYMMSTANEQYVQLAY